MAWVGSNAWGLRGSALEAHQRKQQRITLDLAICDTEFDREYILTSPTGRALTVTATALAEANSYYCEFFDATRAGAVTLIRLQVEYLMGLGIVR